MHVWKSAPDSSWWSRPQVWPISWHMTLARQIAVLYFGVLRVRPGAPDQDRSRPIRRRRGARLRRPVGGAGRLVEELARRRGRGLHHRRLERAPGRARRPQPAGLAGPPVGRGASLAQFPQHSVRREGSSDLTNDRRIGGFAGEIESHGRPKRNHSGEFPGALCDQIRKQKTCFCRPFMELAGLEPATSWVRSSHRS
jgi:hypothetical protein